MITVKHHDPIVVPLKPEEEAKLKKAASRAIAIRVSVLGVAVAIGAAVFIYFNHKANIERHQQLMLQRALQASIAASCEGIASIATAVADMDRTARGLADEARNTVLDVMGQVLEERVQTRPTVEAPPRPKTGLSGMEKGEPPPSRPARRVASRSRDPDAPFGMPTREEMDRLHRMDARKVMPADMRGNTTIPEPPPPSAPAAEPPPVQASPFATQAEAPMESAVTPPPLPREIRVAARKVIQHASAVADKAKELKSLNDDALLVRADAAKALLAGELQNDVAKLKGSLSMAEGIQVVATQELAAAEVALQEVNAIRDRYEEAKKEAARKAEELRKEAERRARVKTEETMVTQAGESIKELLKSMAYVQVVEQLMGRMAEFQTTEGRNGLQNLIDRYNYLRMLKAFLIEQLNRKPFSWGWGRGAASRDVLGADETTIKLRNAEATWADVTPYQMRRFIEEYVTRETAHLGLGKQELGVAIYFQDAGEQDLSASYASKAVTDDPRLREDADRLVRGGE